MVLGFGNSLKKLFEDSLYSRFRVFLVWFRVVLEGSL